MSRRSSSVASYSCTDILATPFSASWSQTFNKPGGGGTELVYSYPESSPGSGIYNFIYNFTGTANSETLIQSLTVRFWGGTQGIYFTLAVNDVDHADWISGRKCAALEVISFAGLNGSGNAVDGHTLQLEDGSYSAVDDDYDNSLFVAYDLTSSVYGDAYRMAQVINLVATDTGAQSFHVDWK